MQFKTVKDVVDHSRLLHKQISEHYHKLSEETSQARVSMLLEYLKRHEDHLEQTLCKFLNINENMSTDDVVEMALKLDDYFIDLYQDMVSSSTSTPVKEVFQNLLDMEEHEKIQLANANK